MDERTQEQWHMLEHAKLSIREVIIADADFYVGPQIRVIANLSATNGQEGTLSIYLALNPNHHRAILVDFFFTEKGVTITPEELVSWQHEVGEHDVTPEVERLTDRIMRLLVMRSIPGYPEHAESVHRAFVNMADV